MTLAGCLTALFGAVLPTITGDQDKYTTLAIQIARDYWAPSGDHDGTRTPGAGVSTGRSLPGFRLATGFGEYRFGLAPRTLFICRIPSGAAVTKD